MNKNRSTPSHIPIRFADDKEPRRKDDRRPSDGGGEADNAISSEEIGRASVYEDATDVQRRIGRGAERDDERGGKLPDEPDTAAAPSPAELPQNRNNQDTAASSAKGQTTHSNAPAAAAAADDPGTDAARHIDVASGPVMAELVATRAELRRVEAELEKTTEERQELLDAIAHRQADFDNFRKRVQRERSETYNRTVGEVVSHLLPVMDNLRRALDAETSVEAGESEEFRHFLHGVKLISNQLNGMLESLGVVPVATVGQPFDPHVHEAVALEETDRYAPDTVIEEMARGYRLGDRLLRPAMVKVAK